MCASSFDKVVEKGCNRRADRILFRNPVQLLYVGVWQVTQNSKIFLFKLTVAHFAPRDRQDAIKGYAIANNERQVLQGLIDDGCIYPEDDVEVLEEIWDWDDDDERACNEVVAKESFLEKMLRIRGKLNDEHLDTSDAYYGVTAYGWDKGIEIQSVEAVSLLLRNIAVDWTGKEACDVH